MDDTTDCPDYNKWTQQPNETDMEKRGPKGKYDITKIPSKSTKTDHYSATPPHPKEASKILKKRQTAVALLAQSGGRPSGGPHKARVGCQPQDVCRRS